MMVAVVRLIGREREVAALERAVAGALSGAGGVAAVSGKPGIGKTTLARAVGMAVAQRGVPVLWGRGVESAPVYWPWLQVLRGRADAVGEAALQVEAGRGAATLARIAPELGSRLAVAPSGEGDGDVDRLRLFDAFQHLLRVAATQAGVVLDDMHWGDSASVRLLTHVAQDLASSRVLLLVNYRSTEWGRGEVVAELDVVRTVTRINLRGLPIAATHHQLESTSGQPVDLALSVRVHTLTGGNPLFVSELGRLLAEDAAAGTPIDDAWPHEVPRLCARSSADVCDASIRPRRRCCTLQRSSVGSFLLPSSPRWSAHRR